MAMSPQLQAAIAAHRFGLGEPDLGDRRPRRRRLARGADRPGRSGARQRAARHAGGAPARRRRARETRAGAQSAARPDRRAGGGRPLPRDLDRRCPLAPRHRRGDAPAVRRAAALVLGQPLHRLGPQGLDPRPGRRVRARRDPAEHRRPLRDPAGRRRPPIRRCCATSTTGCRPGRTRGSSRSRRGARRGAAKARASPASTRTWPARCWSCTRSAPRARATAPTPRPT